MSNTSFHFSTCFCCLLVPLKVMPHHAWVLFLIIRLTTNAITVTITGKGWHWRWLIYALHKSLLLNNMLHVFWSNHHCSWKFHKFHRKTPVLESHFFLKMMKLYKGICSACCQKFFLIDWRHKCLKNAIDLLLFYGECFHEFLKSGMSKCLWSRWKW